MKNRPRIALRTPAKADPDQAPARTEEPSVPKERGTIRFREGFTVPQQWSTGHDR
ncbi:hypothetical protein ACVW0K_007246 [Streptomyces filamentosus]|uniref:hypothetical protein n=1 Tax=Streptomyces filamentosus TaxID=67294 RepID=UPI0036E3F285